MRLIINGIPHLLGFEHHQGQKTDLVPEAPIEAQPETTRVMLKEILKEEPAANYEGRMQGRSKVASRLVAAAVVYRYVRDKPDRPTARVAALTKLLRGLNFDRATNVAIWQQVWAQGMKRPKGRKG